MSGFSTSDIAGGTPPSFLILPDPTVSGRQSATAATQTAISAGRAASQAASISRAVSTSMRRTPLGADKAVGPLTKVTSAPKAARAEAIAYPCLPEERLVSRRTGSMGSAVGPAVTRARLPVSGPGAAPPNAAWITAKISAGSAMRPGPNSPQAIAPSSGPTNCTPSAFRVARFRWVAAWVHMRTFLAGAISTGLSVANRVVEARSPARPCAALAIRSAVAGATTTRSADRDSSMWPISASSVSENSSE